VESGTQNDEHEVDQKLSLLKSSFRVECSENMSAEQGQQVAKHIYSFNI
jgi:hypothetical protein